MGKLTVKQVQAFAAKGKTARLTDAGLIFAVRESYTPTWKLRYSFEGRRKEITLGKYPDLSLADARAIAEEHKKSARDGLDPLLLRKKEKLKPIFTVKALFDDWYENDLLPRIKTHHIQKQVFNTYISPYIGEMNIEQVTPRDVREIIKNITSLGYKAVSNDALGHLKQLFNHAIKLDLLQTNPASAFGISDAGGLEKSRKRALSTDELIHAFKVFNENIESFGRDNYLACCLLLTLSVRKSELCQAPWSEFDVGGKVWSLPVERSKNGIAIEIPLTEQVIGWLKELKIRSFGSDFIFPNRSKSKKPYMGDDTLNRAISKLFGREPGRKVQPENKMGDLEHFSVHDLRRTSRSLMAKVGVPGYIAERCLNHKLKGVEGIYDQYDYFEERKEAMAKIAKIIESIVN